MRLELSYRTRYSYAPAVRDGLTALRLCPTSGPGLEVLQAELLVSPGRLSATHLDCWGTRVDLVELPAPHISATFEVRALVDTRADERDLRPSPAELFLFSGDSARVRRAAVGVLGWSVAEEGASWAAVESALRWLPQRFVYSQGVTDAQTEIEQVIAQGVGVCQDFSHIFLALLRRWGWCARYVSGYVFATTDDEQVEAEAMHAWVEVYRPGIGWIGLDATIGEYADDRYVAVARGRDYDDIRPIRGIFVGATEQTQTAYLQMRRSSQQ